jgi:hypothetical protein
MDDLKEGDKIILSGDTYRVSSNCRFLIIESGYNNNIACFTKLGLDPRQITKDVLGYVGPGIFPECNSPEDLAKLVAYLKAVEFAYERANKVFKEGDTYRVPKDCSREFNTGSVRDDDSGKSLVNHFSPYSRLRFGYHMRLGANKYEKGNWQKGQPVETALESAHRHLAKYELNREAGVEQDEDHLSAIIFNIMLILENEKRNGITVDHFFNKLVSA